MAQRFESDKQVEYEVFGSDIDFDLYSAAQITDLLAKDFIEMADEHAAHYLDDADLVHA